MKCWLSWQRFLNKSASLKAKRTPRFSKQVQLSQLNRPCGNGEGRQAEFLAQPELPAPLRPGSSRHGDALRGVVLAWQLGHSTARTAVAQLSIAVLVHAGMGTVRKRITHQRPSRCWMWANVSRTASSRRSPQPTSTARMARSRFPWFVATSGAASSPSAWRLVSQLPVRTPRCSAPRGCPGWPAPPPDRAARYRPLPPRVSAPPRASG